MTKTHSQYVCQQCGRVSPQELGKCPRCGEWNSAVEVLVTSKSRNPSQGASASAMSNSRPLRLTEIEGDPSDRLPLPMAEFGRVLGGGIVPGSVILIGGDPGIGKSTLILQLAAVMAGVPGKVLYVSGEESTHQIKMRALRVVGDKSTIPDDLYLVTETCLETILSHVEATEARLVIIDSIQTTHSAELNSAAGSVSQVRECAARMTSLAKATGIAVFLVGHVTKEGSIAGPRLLEHMVDTVLYLEGDRYHTYRLLRGVKNRFGPTSEVGVFEMGQSGMTEVTNPSKAFLAERFAKAPGSAITVTMEGTRPLLVEVQALVSKSAFGNPRRTPNGVDFNRLLLVTAVLTRHIGLRLSDQDIFVNVVGGLNIQEPAADLAIAAAIVSSVEDKPVTPDMVLLGEIGLSGEMRAASHLTARLREAAKLGFKQAVIPSSAPRERPFLDDLGITRARTLLDALKPSLRPQ